MDLMKMLQDQMAGAAMDKLSGFLGESSTNTSSAMGAALPSILGSLISKGSNEQGAGGIMDMISGLASKGDMLSNMGSMFGGGNATTGLIDSGGGILKSLMGNKLGGVVDMIASVSGMKKGSSSSLLSMAAPMLLSMIGKKVMGKGVGGLMSLLSSQSGLVKKALPSGMSDLLGLGNLGSSVSETVGAAADTAKSSGGGMLKYLLFGLLALAALGYFGFKTGCDTVDNAADKVSSTTTGLVEGAKDVAGDAATATGNMVDKAGEMAKDGANAVVDGAADLASKALEGITFAAGSVGAKMNDLFSKGGDDLIGKTISFNNLNFATGKATIDKASMEEINNFAALMKAYSKYHVEIGGHTDASGNADSNLKLSQARAEAVKAALETAGVAAERITAKGYGSTMPLGGDTAADRRVEVKVTK